MQLLKTEVQRGNKFYLIITSDNDNKNTYWSTDPNYGAYKTEVYVRYGKIPRQIAMEVISYGIAIDGYYYTPCTYKGRSFYSTEVEAFVYHKRLEEEIRTAPVYAYGT
jgi:hypothetical protein